MTSSRITISLSLFLFVFLLFLIPMQWQAFVERKLLQAALIEIVYSWYTNALGHPLEFRMFMYALLPSLCLTYIQYAEPLMVVMFLFYNSVSDAIQYMVGKTFGKTQVFSVTTKSLEGYVGGLLLTTLLFSLIGTHPIFILFNVLGMLGGLISSYVKRGVGIKDWSGLLGPHGGINDRLDSLILPLLVYEWIQMQRPLL